MRQTRHKQKVNTKKQNSATSQELTVRVIFQSACVLTHSMIDWIKQGIEKVVPQPEIHVRSKTEAEAPAPAKGVFTSYSATNHHYRPI